MKNIKLNRILLTRILRQYFRNSVYSFFSKVFGKLIQGKVASMDSSVEESKDLKEHMVGILFSQSKLTHLQKQVISLSRITSNNGVFNGRKRFKK